MSDRELLELAAKAAGYTLGKHTQSDALTLGGQEWNPISDDVAAFRLAVKLNMGLVFDIDLSEVIATDPYAATRRAIVRAAAEIGRQMT